MAIQWHPLFVYLLRPMLEDYYEVKTGLEVGDAPRQADLVLLRRTDKQPNFHGIWRHLSPWNILEYKGPTVSARLEHIDLLVELGLGIERRLNELGRKEKQSPVPFGDVSFWYLAHNIGGRFLKRIFDRLEKLEPISAGIWSCLILGRSMFLVSVTDLPVEEESTVFHLLHSDPNDKGLSALRLTAPHSGLWDLYRQVFESLHPDKMEEVDAMAKTKKKGPQFHLKEVAEYIGMDRAIEELGKDRIIETIGKDEIIKKIGKDEIIEKIGVDDVIDRVFSLMNDSQRAALERRLLEAKKPKK